MIWIQMGRCTAANNIEYPKFPGTRSPPVLAVPKRDAQSPSFLRRSADADRLLHALNPPPLFDLAVCLLRARSAQVVLFELSCLAFPDPALPRRDRPFRAHSSEFPQRAPPSRCHGAHRPGPGTCASSFPASLYAQFPGAVLVPTQVCALRGTHTLPLSQRRFLCRPTS